MLRIVPWPVAVLLLASACDGCVEGCAGAFDDDEPARPEVGLAAFAGGFDPTRHDAGPLAPARADALGRALVFNVPPFYADKIAAGAASSLEDYLEEETGIDVDVRSPRAYDYAQIVDGLERGEVDVAELSPYQFVLLTQRGLPITPIAATVAHGASMYGSYLVVRHGSSIRRLDDLKGKRIAFVDPLSTSGYLLPRLYLRDHGFRLDASEGQPADVEVVFAGGHPQALALVRSGAVDCAAVSSDLLIGESGLAGPLVVLAKVGRMPYDVIVARKDLDPTILAQVRAALLRLSIHDERGREALKAFSAVDAFMPVPPNHYDGIFRLGAQLERTMPKP